MTALEILKKVRSEMRPNAKAGEYELMVILKAMHDFAALRQPLVSGSVCPCNELPDGEIAISSKALQKPYGDLG